MIRKKRRWKKINRKLKKIFYKFLIFLFLFLSIIIIWNLDYWKIKNIEINFEGQNIFLKKENIKEKIQEYLKEKYFIFFDKNIFLFNKKQLKEELQKDFLEIKNLKIDDNFEKRKIEIKIEEKKPIYIYEYKDEKYWLNSKGLIFKKIKKKDNEEGILILTSENKINLNQNFFKNIEEKNKILNFKKNIEKRFGIKINKIKRIYSTFWIFETNNNVKLYFKSDFNQDDLFLRLEKFFEKTEAEVMNNKIQNTAYIDLILKNKIIYCLKGKECDE